MIYLDNAATTKIHEEVLKKMIDVLAHLYGNPSSKYYEQAIKAKVVVEKSREQVKKFFNSNSHQVIFNSGATEGNNHILKSIFHDFKGRLIISSIEHSSVSEVADYLKLKGVDVFKLPVDKNGLVDTSDLINAIDENTRLISVIFANNETGVINNIEELSKIAHDYGVLFHSDVTQAIGKVNIDLAELSNIDFATFSAHKIFGPKGIGALLTKNHINSLIPLIHGGQQENGLRAGTSATHQIVGLGYACEIAMINLDNNIEKLNKEETKLKLRLQKEYKSNVVFIIDEKIKKVPGLISVRFKGINNQVLLNSISAEIAASSGSACSNTSPSKVLKAMGLNDETIKEVVRFSLSPYDDYEDFLVFQ